MNIDSNIISEDGIKKLEELNNPHAIRVVEEYTKLCKPEKITVITDSDEDINYVRELAIKSGEEKKLVMEGHTIHYDGYSDQARDKNNTKVLGQIWKTCPSRAVIFLKTHITDGAAFRPPAGAPWIAVFVLLAPSTDSVFGDAH